MTPERDDPIIDACLDEVLGGNSPPDLSARIMQAWATQQAAGGTDVDQGSLQRLSRAADRAAAQLPPPANAPNVPIPVGASGKRTTQQSLPVPTPRRKKLAWETWVAIASVLVIGAFLAGIVLPQLRPGNKQLAHPHGNNQQHPEVAPTAPVPAPSQNPQLASDDKPVKPVLPDRSSEPKIVERPDKPSPTPNVIASSDLPAEKTSTPNQLVAPTIEPLPGKQLVQFVNLQLSQSWKDNHVQPAPLATDAEWCRRVFLRLLGRIPTVEEVQQFTRDRRSDHREQLVTKLLESELYAAEFNRHWGAVWTNILIGRVASGESDDPVRREALERYLTAAFARKLPYDRVVTELITAQGDSQSDDVQAGAVHFLLSGYKPDATVATNRIARIFLGVNLQCAQCHNHPTNDWGQADYWSLNAFLRQMQVQQKGKSAQLTDRDLVAERGDADEAEVYYQTPSGLIKVAYPRFIDGTEVSHAGDLATINRRQRLAQLVVNSPEMPLALVNRMWAQFFGYGFTKPVDDMGSGNQPSHPELLQKLADQFIAYDYDLRDLMRWIVLSDPFQRSSRIPANSQADAPEAGSVALFSRYYTRQMQADEVYDSLLIAARFRKEQGAASEPIIAQGRVDWASQFARSMSTDDMAEESTFDGSVRQSLIMMNGDLMQRVTNPEHDGVLRGVLQSPLPFDEKVQHLFLAALSRPPVNREKQVANQLLQANHQDAKAALQDLWWALLNSNEFILDH